MRSIFPTRKCWLTEQAKAIVAVRVVLNVSKECLDANRGWSSLAQGDRVAVDVPQRAEVSVGQVGD